MLCSLFKLAFEEIVYSVDFFSTVKCIRDPTGFHSDKLHDALQEGDTKTVARIILGKNKVSAKEMLLEIILCFLLMLLFLKRDA